MLPLQRGARRTLPERNRDGRCLGTLAGIRASLEEIRRGEFVAREALKRDPGGELPGVSGPILQTGQHNGRQAIATRLCGGTAHDHRTAT